MNTKDIHKNMIKKQLPKVYKKGKDNRLRGTIQTRETRIKYVVGI